MEKQINWQPQHFPVGSVVILDGYKRVNGEIVFGWHGNADMKNAEVNVVGVTQYAPDSYWIVTDEPDIRNLDISKYFDFSHVASIRKRGCGPVKIVNWYDSSKMIDLKRLIAYGILNKHRYYVTSTHELFAYLIYNNKSFQSGMMIRSDFVEFFTKQTFVKTYKFPGSLSGYISADKKKTRKWIQQNINRLIMPMKEVRRINKEKKEQEYAKY